jgi:hypothetical protein
VARHAEAERARPTPSLKRRYEATHNPDEANAEGKGVKETRAQKLRREIERLTNENDDPRSTERNRLARPALTGQYAAFPRQPRCT